MHAWSLQISHEESLVTVKTKIGKGVRLLFVNVFILCTLIVFQVGEPREHNDSIINLLYEPVVFIVASK